MSRRRDEWWHCLLADPWPLTPDSSSPPLQTFWRSSTLPSGASPEARPRDRRASTWPWLKQRPRTSIANFARLLIALHCAGEPVNIEQTLVSVVLQGDPSASPRAHQSHERTQGSEEHSRHLVCALALCSRGSEVSSSRPCRRWTSTVTGNSSPCTSGRATSALTATTKWVSLKTEPWCLGNSSTYRCRALRCRWTCPRRTTRTTSCSVWTCCTVRWDFVFIY